MSTNFRVFAVLPESEKPLGIRYKMSVVIEAQNISKQFFLGERNQRAFFEDVAAKSARGFRRLFYPKEKKKDEASKRDFWALQDVSFRILQGQNLGIIGQNGAGKSTLLKVLSRITQPTTGTVKVYGRLASLLDVGTGFHPEFSGRDNVYLNGTMLGLSRKEVRKRFDQIVDFSGLEQFIDLPVKNYSSGMYVRLAFSVAAHLNPEIVILDEVLAVGDAVFHKKCFDRMEEIINQGHAAILVSHGMGNIRRMSQTCMWLHHGRVRMFGPTHEVVAEYEKETTQQVVSDLEKQTAHANELSQSEPIARLVNWSVETKLSPGTHTIDSSPASVAFRFEIELKAAVPEGRIAISLANIQGLVLYTHSSELQQKNAGTICVGLELPLLPINPGQYILSCTISDGTHPLAFLRAAPELTVLEGRDAGRFGYDGVLNLPAKLSVDGIKI
jgi:lipopolysaccharide transport system ATP-binding protein